MVMKRFDNEDKRTETFLFHGLVVQKMDSGKKEPHRVVLAKTPTTHNFDKSKEALEGVVGRVARVSQEAYTLRAFANLKPKQRREQMKPHYAEARRAIDTAKTLLLPQQAQRLKIERDKIFALPKSDDSTRAREIRERFVTQPPQAKAALIEQIRRNDPAVRHISLALADDPFSNPDQEFARTILNAKIVREKATELKALDDQETTLETAWSGVAAMQRVLDQHEHATLETFDAALEKAVA